MISRKTRNEGEITITLAAGEKRDYARACRNYMCISATTSGAITIGFDQEPTKPVRQGMGDGVPYDEPDVERLYFANPTGSTETIVITTSFGTIVDNRLNLVSGVVPISGAVTVTSGTVSISGTVPISEVYPSTVTPAASNSLAGSTSLDIAANSSRRLLMIYNDDATGTVWWRDQGGTTTAGVPIGPKQSIAVTFIGASRVRNNTAGACVIYVTELT